MNRVGSRKESGKCPRGGSWRMGDILYGSPSHTPRVHKDLEAERTVLGGCLCTNNDPVWQCVDCGAQIYRERELKL